MFGAESHRVPRWHPVKKDQQPVSISLPAAGACAAFGVMVNVA
jgi:hypothetical protein